MLYGRLARFLNTIWNEDSQQECSVVAEQCEPLLPQGGNTE